MTEVLTNFIDWVVVNDVNDISTGKSLAEEVYNDKRFLIALNKSKTILQWPT